MLAHTSLVSLSISRFMDMVASVMCCIWAWATSTPEKRKLDWSIERTEINVVTALNLVNLIF